VYNIPASAPHILGRTGKIQNNIEEYRAKGYDDDAIVGIDGAEKAFEEYLRGIDGELVRTYDKETGNLLSEEYKKVPIDDTDEYYIKEPVAGKDVYLTIDIKLQQVTEYSIQKGIDRIHGFAYNQRFRLDPNINGADAEAGTAAIINPTNGEVLALATYPSYDISTAYSDMDVYKELNENPLKPFENRATRGQYAPGSVFKIATSVAALCNGNISPYTSFYCEGKYTKYPSYQPTCWIFPGFHGPLNLFKALAHSCNCYYFNVGELVNMQKLNEYAKQLGLGDKTGIEIDEKPGNVISEKNDGWVRGYLLRASIGQLSTYTPLQMAVMLGTVMIGGERYKAHLLLYVKEYGSDEIYYAPEPEIIDSIEISETNLNAVRSGLGSVIELGPAATLFNNMPGLRVAGKTGTVEKVSNRSEDATFVAAAPFNKPEISMSVVIEKGAHGTWAGYVSEDVFAYYFKYKTFEEVMNIPVEEPEIDIDIIGE
jgi:penicillin-binding protein 2